MDFGSMMVTLIDDGRVENCSNDSIPSLDLNQCTIIDVDNIDATIEDPGYILDEAATFNQTKEYESSYKKQSFTLPVTFFDISRNVRLLKKCRPISIKIVDCDIYPWYYKEIKHMMKNGNAILEKDEDFNQSGLDLISLKNFDTPSEKSLYSMGMSNIPKINLSSEQRSVVLKLKEEIENQVNEIIVHDVDEEKTVRNQRGISQSCQIPQLNKNTDKYSFDKSIEANDLLTYKEIAQAIVRNIDLKEVNNKTYDVTTCFQNPKININSEDEIFTNCHKTEHNKILEKKGKINEKLVTSPILPYTIRPGNIAKQKEKMLKESNGIFGVCSNFSKPCDKIKLSNDKIIPHYQYKPPIPAINTTNLYNSNMVTNQRSSLEPITNDPSFHWPISKNTNLFGYSDSITTPDSQGKLVTPANSNTEMSYHFNKINCNNSFINSWQVPNQQAIDNINSNMHLPISHYQCNYSTTLPQQNNYYATPEIPSQFNIHNINNRRSVGRANPRYITPSNLSGNRNCIPNSMSSINECANYGTMQSPLPRTVSNMTNVIQSNPLLSQLLNCNKYNEYYQAPVERCEGVVHRPIMRRTSHSSMGQNYWFSLRTPPPTYEHYLSSTQFSQNSCFQYPNGEIHSVSNSMNRNLIQQTTNASPSHPETNIIKQSLLNEYDNSNLPTNAQKVSNSMLPRIDTIKLNICSHTQLQSVNQISPVSFLPNAQKLLNSKNTQVKTQDIVNKSIKHLKIFNQKALNGDNSNTIIKVSSRRKPNILTTKVGKRNVKPQKKVSISNNNTFYPVQQICIPNPCQSDSKLKNVQALKVNNTALHPTKDENIATLEQNKLKVKGYSPPILPIPSFKKSLELLAELQYCQAFSESKNSNLETQRCQNTSEMSNQSINKELINVIRKRKLSDDQKKDINSKKKSLQEYKFRKPDNGFTLI